jgi:peptidyl-tRNA hydrolase
MRKNPKIEYKFYILMRNDLPSLNPGKAMAQAAHAANLLDAQWGLNRGVVDWKHQCQDSFGTTIVLAVDKDTLIYRIRRAQMRDGTVPFGCVYDPTYPFNTTTEIAALIPPRKLTAPMIVKEDNRVMLFRKELTCGYLLVADGSSDQAELVSDLPLYQ